MIGLEAYWTEAVTVLAVAFAAHVFLSRRAARHRQRTRELKQACRALAAHYDALEKVVNDPAAPIEIKNALRDMSAAIPIRMAAQYFALEWANRPPADAEIQDDRGLLRAEVRKLGGSHPDLLDEIEKAIKNGLIALFLRWPETASMFPSLMVDLSTDDRREIDTVVRVSRFSRDRPERGGLLAAS
jgi:hypothetical protein